MRFKLLKMALVDATVEAGSLETPEAKPEATPDAMAEVGSLETPDAAAVAGLASVAAVGSTGGLKRIAGFEEPLDARSTMEAPGGN